MNESGALEDRLNSLLKQYVNSEDKVYYSSLEEDETVENYIRWLESFDPKNLKTKNEKLAFWINTYNRLFIYGVLRQLRKNPDFAKKGHKSIFASFKLPERLEILL